MIELRRAGFVHEKGTPWEARGLRDISLTIAKGERVFVTGPNGSGKSTLAWVVAGRVAPTEGQATVNGLPATELVSSTGFLLQHAPAEQLAPTVAAEASRFDIDPEVHRQALFRLGFDDSILPRKVDEMSLGQQRRVALAGLLARECPVLVLDEPLAGLDKRSVQQLFDAFADLAASTTVITITHDIDASAPLGSRIVSLDEGQLVADES